MLNKEMIMTTIIVSFSVFSGPQLDKYLLRCTNHCICVYILTCFLKVDPRTKPIKNVLNHNGIQCNGRWDMEELTSLVAENNFTQKQKTALLFWLDTVQQHREKFFRRGPNTY